MNSYKKDAKGTGWTDPWLVAELGSTQELFNAKVSKRASGHESAKALDPKSEHYHKKDSWLMGSVSEAVEIAGGGVWIKGRDTYRRMMSELGSEVPRVKSRRRRRRRSEVDGVDIDAERFAMRSQDFWYEEYRENNDAPGSACVRLVVQSAASASVNGDQYFWSGVAATIFADRLEAAGYSVRIEWVSAVRRAFKTRGTSGLLVTMPIKSEQEPLDLDRCIAWLSHPGVYRTLGLKSTMLHNRAPRLSLGWPVKAQNLMESLDMADENTVFGAFINECTSKKDALKWLSEKLEPYGIQ